MHLTLLGTGCPSVHPERYGPSNLIPNNNTKILIDCGSGVTQRLVQSGFNGAEIDYLLLTHLHSDHVVDFYQLIISSWHQYRKKSWNIIGPLGTASFINSIMESWEEERELRISYEKRDSIKAFRPFFKRGYDKEEMGADPLSRYQRRFGPDAYYKLREPFVELNLKSKDLTKKYEKELFDVLEGEDALARLYPEEYIKFLNAGRDLRLLFKLDRVAARKIAQFMNLFKMSVAHSFPADFVKTQKMILLK